MLRQRFLFAAMLCFIVMGYIGCILDSTGGLFTGSTGSGASGGTGGSVANTSSTGGNGETSSSTGGETTVTSSSVGGNSSSSSSTGGGGGCNAPTTCFSGTSDTPQSVTASGNSATSAYLYDSTTGAEQYSGTTPALINLVGTTNPGQLVVSGQGGITINFTYGGGSPLGEEFFTADVSNVAECIAAAYTTQACEVKVGRDFRCTYFPCEEDDGCADITTTYVSLGKKMSYSNGAAGFSKILVSIRCEP